ncbi:MAG: NAD(P)H-hydrate dehydratase [Candidatus Nanopelagicales bacterium]
MRALCTAAQMAAAEVTVGVPEPVLMDRAATALAAISADWLGDSGARVYGRRVCGLVGAGNNGGDVLWALAKLARRGVGVAAAGDPARMHEAGRTAFLSSGGNLVDAGDARAAAVCGGADLVLDGIVGIGGKGGLREPFAALITGLAGKVPIVAADLPSGVDADTGAAPGPAVQAAVTATFGVVKVGLAVQPGRGYAGVVTLVDIGVDPALIEATAWQLDLADLAGMSVSATEHKYSRGVVEVVAGSGQFPGASLLASAGARDSGAGMVVLRGGPGADTLSVVHRYPEVVPVTRASERATARVVGPGLGEQPAALAMLEAALESPLPLVIDASGLTWLSSPGARAGLVARTSGGHVTVLTPHEGEFARLGGDLAGGRVAAAAAMAERLGVVVVLKGSGTVIAAPLGPVYVDPFGSAELATAGSGDVLAGLIGGMLAAAAARAARAGRNLTLADAAKWAAVACGRHGLAGRLAGERSGTVTATDIAAELGRAALLARTAD